MKKFFLFFLVVGGAGLHAQPPAPGPAASATPVAAASPPPALFIGPLLKPVADLTRWTLTTTVKHQEDPVPGASPGQSPATGKPGEKEKAKGPVTTTTIGERMGKKAHLLTTNSSGGREEKWSDGALLAVTNQGASAPTFTTEGMEKMPTPTWISRENFSAVQDQGEKKYFVFRTRKMPNGLEIVRDMEAEAQGHTQNTDNLMVESTAVIDADTRLPIAVKEGETTTTYKFEPLAPDTQIIPPAIQAAFAEREKKMQEAVRKSVRP